MELNESARESRISPNWILAIRFNFLLNFDSNNSSFSVHLLGDEFELRLALSLSVQTPFLRPLLALGRSSKSFPCVKHVEKLCFRTTFRSVPCPTLTFPPKPPFSPFICYT